MSKLWTHSICGNGNGGVIVSCLMNRAEMVLCYGTPWSNCSNMFEPFSKLVPFFFVKPMCIYVNMCIYIYIRIYIYTHVVSSSWDSLLSTHRYSLVSLLYEGPTALLGVQNLHDR